MKVNRINTNNITISPETPEEQSYLESQLGWVKKGTLENIIAELKGYGVKE